MFAIVISEKGGAERREIFDKHEINVGRVQGNDLMLPKGNVSKRHARLLFRDGRVIVTDLRSTNGTYVNGRKIAQATIVREGDKIYVGDFVLRVELTGATSSHKTSGSSIASAPSSPSTLAAPSARPSLTSVTHESEFTARHEGLVPGSDSGESTTGRHAPLEASDVPSPSQGPALHTAPQQAPPPPRPLPPPDPSAIPIPPAPRSSQVAPAPSVASRGPVSHPSLPPSSRRITGRAVALSALIDRVAETIDLAPLSRGAEPDQVLAHRIERVVREKGKQLRDEGHLPTGVEVEDSVRDAQRELFGLGALEPLLDDEDVIEIRVFGHGSVTAVRAGETIEIDPAFSSEAAVYRALVRLCRQSQAPLAAGETVVERYLPRGLLVHAVLPPTSQYGHAIVIRKRRRAEAGLDDLVRSGTVSRAMATFLRGCSTARANLLLVGPPDGTALLTSALASAGSAGERIVALQTIDELWGLEPEPIVIRLPDATTEDATKLVRAAAKLRPDRLIVSPLAGQVAAAVVGAIAEGNDGVVAAIAAPSLRHALDRLVGDLMATRIGLSSDAAATWLLGSFELAVEIARLRDGRFRVMRVAELYVGERGVLARDVFTFMVERTAVGGAVEGSFVATGVVPRMAEDFAARGGQLDSAVFRR